MPEGHTAHSIPLVLVPQPTSNLPLELALVPQLHILHPDSLHHAAQVPDCQDINLDVHGDYYALF